MILFKKSCKLFAVSIALLFLFTGCTTEETSEVIAQPIDLSAPITFDSVEAEREAIFSLGAYVVVYKNWQTNIMNKKNNVTKNKDGSPIRGFNIGSILVNKDNIPVDWARNSIAKENDETQHGEVRVIQKYIRSQEDIKLLNDYTIYTTLEPCIMCAGMMSMVLVKHTVYGQTDGDYDDRTGFGNAIERIKLDSTSIDGYKPYPRGVETSKVSNLPYRKALDYAYNNGTTKSITEFLTTDEAKDIYAQANDFFYAFKVKYDENIAIYNNTKELLEKVD